YGGINFSGKAITLQSTDPNDWDVVAATVIDGNGATNGVLFNSGEGSGSVLTGLTVTGDTYGIYCNDTSPTISKCIIRDNSVRGIDSYDGAPIIINNKIYNNGDVSVYFHSPTTGTIVSNNLIHDANYGIIILGLDGTATVSNNTLVRITKRGIARVSGTSPTITNCIVWDCNDDLYGCSVTYSCIQDGDTGTGNLSSYPFFADYDANDFHLTWNSPCINKGDPNGNYDGQTDIDNENRVFEEQYYSNRADMGADEFDSINENLVQNPGFELSGGGLTGGGDPDVPLYWLERLLSAISIDSTEYHSDGNSCKNICSGSSWVGLYSDFIPVDINKTYTFSAWVKGQTGNEDLLIHWQEHPDDSGSPNSGTCHYLYANEPATTYWRRWHKMLEPGDTDANTRFISMELLGKASEGTIWFDDVNVTENIPEFLPAYGCVNEPNLAFTIKFGGIEKNTYCTSGAMSDPCTDQDDNNITYRVKTGKNLYVSIPAFNIDPTTGLPLTPMLLEIMYKDTTSKTDMGILSRYGSINLDPNYEGIEPNDPSKYIAHLGDSNDNKWKYIQCAFQKSDYQLLRAINGIFNIVIASLSSTYELPISYISLRAITQEDYDALINKQRDMKGFYELELPEDNPSNPNYADPDLTVFVRD
ncbi:MAG: right-handed parallel beta-helix repeat-containing protein, partial [Phycisphaerae bacterium]